jgi:hypothetical protein
LQILHANEKAKLQKLDELRVQLDAPPQSRPAAVGATGKQVAAADGGKALPQPEEEEEGFDGFDELSLAAAGGGASAGGGDGGAGGGDAGDGNGKS